MLKRIQKLDEYKPEISYKDGFFILKIYFNKSWNIILPENDERVAHSKTKEKDNLTLHWFVSTIDDSDFLFSVVEEIINVNKTFEKKYQLFRLKVKELEEIFLSDIDYDTLTQLQFTFNENVNKKNKRTKKIKKETTPQITETTSTIEEKVDVNKISDIDKKVEEALQC